MAMKAVGECTVCVVARCFVPPAPEVRAVERRAFLRVFLVAVLTSPIRPFSDTEAKILVRWRSLNQRQALPRYQ